MKKYLMVLLFLVVLVVSSTENMFSGNKKSQKNNLTLNLRALPSETHQNNSIIRTNLFSTMDAHLDVIQHHPSIATESISTYLSMKLVSGAANSGTTGDNSPATSAQVKPGKIWVDPTGNIYIPDGGTTGRIRKISSSDGIIRVFGGTGGPSTAGVSATIGSVIFNNLQSMVGDTAGNALYISDQLFIWKYSFSTNIASTFAHDVAQPKGFSGDGSPATSAQLYSPLGLWLTSTNVLYIADFKNHRIRKVSGGIITTVAGSGCASCVSSFSGDGQPATSATLNEPRGVYMDTNGKLFIADGTNNRIRVVDTNNIITTFAGTGTATPYNNDNLPAISVNIDTPLDVKGDYLGNIYIADKGNCLIRIVETNGILSNLFGTAGSCSTFSTGSTARTGPISSPQGIWVDSKATIYFCDGNSIHRSLDLTPTSQPSSRPTQPSSQPSSSPTNPTGLPTQRPSNQPTSLPSSYPSTQPTSKPSHFEVSRMQLLAGSSTNGFSGDGGAATSALLVARKPFVDTIGNIYLPDGTNARIRKITPSGIITTFGGAGGPPTHLGASGPIGSVSFNIPVGMTGDTAGTVLYIADQDYLWKYTFSTNIVAVFAGTGTPGFTGDNGPATSAQLNFPFGAWLTTAGDLYVVENKNNRVRLITSTGGNDIITSVAGSTSVDGFSGDGAAATLAKLKGPRSVYVDTNGLLYIADYGNNRIRRVAATSDKTITTFAGSGATAYNGDNIPVLTANLNGPNDMKGDNLGNVYISISTGCLIRVVNSNGILSTVFGDPVGGCGFTPGISLPTSSIYKASGLWIDSKLTIYFSDEVTVHRSVNLSPTSRPSSQPTCRPSVTPSRQPSGYPTSQPSRIPSSQPSSLPSSIPTNQPSRRPSTQPSGHPSSQPSSNPSSQPSGQPTSQPSRIPSSQPSSQPSSIPTNQPSRRPSTQPSSHPSSQPSRDPSSQPSGQPSSQPSRRPYGSPSGQPTSIPSRQPGGQPSRQPIARPSGLPSKQPTGKPSCQPTSIPSSQPVLNPTTSPTQFIPDRLKEALVAYYPFDGDAQDKSGNHNHGTVFNTSLTSDRNGVANSAYFFNGASYIYAQGKAFAFSNAMAVSLWIKPCSAQPVYWADVLTKGFGEWYIETVSDVFGEYYFAYNGVGGGQYSGSVGMRNFTADPNKWSHLVFSKDAVENKIHSYVNLNYQGSISYEIAEMATGPDSLLTFGGQPLNDDNPPTSVGYYFCGSIDEVYIYNRSLQYTEIVSLFQLDMPSSLPTEQPTSIPSNQPNVNPSVNPSCQPTCIPSSQPTALPSGQPSRQPITSPSGQPSRQPIPNPSGQPSRQPTASPTGQPSRQPTSSPTRQPNSVPSRQPSAHPSSQPSSIPTGQPVANPSGQPTSIPSRQPTALPSGQPSRLPTTKPSGQPSRQPVTNPTGQPSRQPIAGPTGQPSRQPTAMPSGQPSSVPSSQPIANPTTSPTPFLPETLKDGLVAYYPFDGNTQDKSGNHNHGTVHEATLTSDRNGIANSAYSFDGVSSYIYAAGEAFNFRNTMAISLWLSPCLEQTDFYIDIISKGIAEWYVEQTSDLLNHFYFGYTNGTSTFSGIGGTDGLLAPSSTWTHLVLSKDAVENKIHGYVNLIYKGSVSFPDGDMASTSYAPLIIGAGPLSTAFPPDPNAMAYFFCGSMDEIYFYNRTLQYSEIVSLFELDAPSSLPSGQPTSIPSTQPFGNPTAKPSDQPTVVPSRQPVGYPSAKPSDQPTAVPSRQPVGYPSAKPSKQPTSVPSRQPSGQPTSRPSGQPSIPPSSRPTSRPSRRPIGGPSSQPTGCPTVQPSSRPSTQPVAFPTVLPSDHPTSHPSTVSSSLPSRRPSVSPSHCPSSQPSRKPSKQPTGCPSSQPISVPTNHPSSQPTGFPSNVPSVQPSNQPTAKPSTRPTDQPTRKPTCWPTNQPTNQPSSFPTKTPSVIPTSQPNQTPTSSPSSSPTHPTPRPSTEPTIEHTNQPVTEAPTLVPSVQPSVSPSSVPFSTPTEIPTGCPTVQPSSRPSGQPTDSPKCFPTGEPTSNPTNKPRSFPSSQPTSCPSAQPSNAPQVKSSGIPTMVPSAVLSGVPTLLPTVSPSAKPSVNPTIGPSVLPTVPPTLRPTAVPSILPTFSPTTKPTFSPSVVPTAIPTSRKPTILPTPYPTFLAFNNGTLPVKSGITVFSSSSSDFPSFKQQLFMFYPLFQGATVLSNITVSASTKGNNLIIFGSSHETRPDIQIGNTKQDNEYEKIGFGFNIDPSLRSMSILGDINNDNNPDLVIGDPVKNQAYVLFGNNQGFTHLKNGFTITGENSGDNLGWAVSSAGDFNQDGFEDILVSAWMSGKCYVIFGKAVGFKNLPLSELTARNGMRITGNHSEVDQFGLAVTGAGDFNADGYHDIIITGRGDRGANTISLIYGFNTTSKGVNLNLNSFQNGKWGIQIRSPALSFAGLSLTDLGDINGDGFDDIALGSVPYRSGLDIQVTYIIYGNLINSDILLSHLSPERGMKIIGGGIIVSRANDVDGDGINDINIVDYPDWQGQTGSFLIPILDKRRSRKPSTFPTSQPTKSLPPPTDQPSSRPSIAVFVSDTPSQWPTSFPSGIYSSRPTIATTSIPTITASTRIPTVFSSKKPSLVPSVIPSKTPSLSPSVSPSFIPSFSPSTRNPSFRPTKSPTVSPTINQFPSSFPSASPTIPLDQPFTTKEITSGGRYNGSEKTEVFVISSQENTIITGTKGGRNTFKVIPRSNVTITLTNFQNTVDKIDLTEFASVYQSLEQINYATTSFLTLILFNEQVICLPSHSSFDLSANNFIFGVAPPVQNTDTTNSKGIMTSVGFLGHSQALVVISCFAGMLLVTLFCVQWSERGKKEKRSFSKELYKKDTSNNKEPQHQQQTEKAVSAKYLSGVLEEEEEDEEDEDDEELLYRMAIESRRPLLNGFSPHSNDSSSLSGFSDFSALSEERADDEEEYDNEHQYPIQENYANPSNSNSNSNRTEEYCPSQQNDSHHSSVLAGFSEESEQDSVV
jgi:hypothetical protein